MPIEVDDVGFVVGLVQEGVEHGVGKGLGRNKLRQEEVGQVIALPDLGHRNKVKWSASVLNTPTTCS